MKWHKRVTGFTMIELMVVMAIIVTLASLLMPALQKARENAKRAVCSNNQKQIGQGIHTFADDHDDKFPIDMTGSVIGRRGLILGTNCVKLSFVMLNPKYIKPFKTFICPSSRTDKPASNPTQFINDTFPDAATCSYAYYCGLNESVRSDTAIVMDKTYYRETVGAYGNLAITRNADYAQRALNHGDSGVNVLFVDGHVKWIKSNKLKTDDIPNLAARNFLNPDNY